LCIMDGNEPWIPTIVLELCLAARAVISRTTFRLRSSGHSTNTAFPAMMLGRTVWKWRSTRTLQTTRSTVSSAARSVFHFS
jgi:hypothetical protein